MKLKLKNRYLPIAFALAFTGLVASQIPSPSSISSAASSISLVANAYPGESSTNNTAPLAVAGVGIITSVVGGAGAGAAGAAAGGDILAGPTVPGDSISWGESFVINSGGFSITISFPNTPTTQSVVAIFRNVRVLNAASSNVADLGLAGVLTQPIGTKEVKAEGYTLLLPTDDSLIKALGAEKVARMQKPEGRELARAFVSGLIVPGQFNYAGLKDAASLSKSVSSLGGDSISLKVDGGKLMANGVEVLATEYAARNVSFLVTNGVVNGN